VGGSFEREPSRSPSVGRLRRSTGYTSWRSFLLSGPRDDQMRRFAFQLAHQAVRIEASTLPPPIISYVGGRIWRLEQQYGYTDGPHRISVASPFGFDLSSIPRVFWMLIAPVELSFAAPLVHDFMYRYAGVPPEGSISPPRAYTRRQSDDLFGRIMEQEGVAGWRRGLAYFVVRIFASSAWRKTAPEH
jgi:hypothetical protein